MQKRGRFFFNTIYNNKGLIIKTLGYVYDITAPDNQGILHTYTYDIYGRKSTETAPYTQLAYTYYDKSRKVKVTDNLRSIYSIKDFDALGRIIEAQDAGGTITYEYTVTPDIQHKTTIKSNGSITNIVFDLWGNRRSINESNAGMIKSIYNNLNELLSQIDARGDTTTYQYDALGRVSKKIFSASWTPEKKTIIYTYDNDAKGIGKLTNISSGNNAENFKYDNYGRLSKQIKQIESVQHPFNYTYNTNGQLQTLTYPGGFEVIYNYESEGNLKDIRNSSDNSLIYEVLTRNRYNLPLSCTFGNGIMTQHSYNPYGLITDIKTGEKVSKIEMFDSFQDRGLPGGYYVDSSVFCYSYTYNNLGLMRSRSETNVNKLETFTYDPLDRLKSVTSGEIGQQGTPQTFSYHNNGNISSNSDVGMFYYGEVSGRPHAISRVETINDKVISTNTCNISYNFFNQPSQITEGDYQLNLFYGLDQQRNKTMNYEKGVLVNTRYHAGKLFEREIDKERRYYHYIYGENDLVAICVSTLTTDTTDVIIQEPQRGKVNSMYYVHTDHLGSICAITDSKQKVVQRNYFDPWGNPASSFFRGENPEEPDSIKKPQPNIRFALTMRGFTGHEHYPHFSIINMNGRLYDPVVARFFSPDKHVANSSFTQDFNRYTYGRNNPLLYTDPNGEFFQYLIWGAHFLFTGFENMLNGVSDPWKNAKQQATGFVNGVKNSWQFPVYKSNNLNVNAGIDMFGFGVSANAIYSQGGRSIGISAGYSAMGGGFITGGFSQDFGDWNFGLGFGAGKNHLGVNAQAGHKYFSIGYGQTFYGNAPSIYDGKAHKQTTGTLSAYTPWGTFRIENDFFGDGKDRWRTSAIEISFGPVVIGSNVYTNAPDLDMARTTYNSRFWNKSKDAYADGTAYSSPAWMGIRDGNMVARMGINHPKVQDITQNGWHYYGSKSSPFFPTPYGSYYKPFFYNGYYSPFSLY